MRGPRNPNLQRQYADRRIRLRSVCAVLLLALGAAFLLDSSYLLAAEAPPQKLQLRGRILLPPGTLRPRRWISVSLFAVGTPFYKRTTAHQDGRFSFKQVTPGTYTITFSVPRVGQLSQTVEVTPSFADDKGRVDQLFEYTPEKLALLLRPDERATVSVRELSISYQARREFEKAQAKLRDNDADAALEHLHKAIAESPEFLEAVNTLGIVYFQRKQYAEAERQFRRALEIDEEALDALVNLGGVLLMQGKGEEALRINERAYEGLPNDALAAVQLGLSYYLSNDYGQAIRYLERAKELDVAHFSLPQLTLAQIFLRLGQAEEAIEELKEFVKLHPDSLEIPRVRELEKNAQDLLKRQALMDASGQ